MRVTKKLSDTVSNPLNLYFCQKTAKLACMKNMEKKQRIQSYGRESKWGSIPRVEEGWGDLNELCDSVIPLENLEDSVTMGQILWVEPETRFKI